MDNLNSFIPYKGFNFQNSPSPLSLQGYAPSLLNTIKKLKKETTDTVRLICEFRPAYPTRMLKQALQGPPDWPGHPKNVINRLELWEELLDRQMYIYGNDRNLLQYENLQLQFNTRNNPCR